MFVAKWARYGWSLELRSLLRGGGQAEPGVSAHSQRCARTGRPHGQRSRRRSRTVDRGTPEADAEPAPAWRKDRHPGQSRAVHPSAHGRRRHRSPASGQRTGHRARAGDARLLRRVGRPRQRQRRSRNGGPQRPRPRAARGGVLSHPPRVALRGRAAGLLLRLFERRAVAAVPRGARAAGVPRRRLAAVSRRQPEVRRRGVQRSGFERSDHPGAGLSFRPGAGA